MSHGRHRSHQDCATLILQHYASRPNNPPQPTSTPDITSSCSLLPTPEYTSCQPASQPASHQAAKQLGAGRLSKFPSTSKQIQHHWHTIRSHNHSCNKMAKQWCLDSGRIFNVRTWPALRAGQAQTLKYLPLCKPHCLAILLQLWLWLLIECQQC